MKSRKGTTIIEVLTLIFFLVMVFFGIFRGIFASEDLAIRALEKRGYSNIQITDHKWFCVGLRGADTQDAAMFEATATNPVGEEVEVYVCRGWPFKGGTVRSR